MRSVQPILATLLLGAAFEAMTLLATKVAAVRAVSPWQDDPYDVGVSFALVAVPALGLAIAARLPAWRAPGAEDRGEQTGRAAAVLLAVVGLVLAAEWAAVAAGAHARAWNAWTAVLVAGLAALTVAGAGVAAGLWRYRSRRGVLRPGPRWTHDWLEDVALVLRRVPAVRRWATPRIVEAVRAHATALFAGVSGLAAVVIVGAQAVGERWTDPLLIAWALLVEAALDFAFCLVANAAAGFVRRTRSRADVPVVAGAAGLALMTAFRDPLYGAVAHRPVTSVPVLVALTVGAGLLAGLVAAAGGALRRRPA